MMKQQIFSVLFLLFLLVLFFVQHGMLRCKTVRQAAQIEAGRVSACTSTKTTFSSDAFDTDDTQQISYLQPVLHFQLQKGQEVDLETFKVRPGNICGLLSSQKTGRDSRWLFLLGRRRRTSRGFPLVISQYDADGQENRNGQFMKSKKTN